MSGQCTPAPWQVNHRDPSQVCDADGEKRGCAPIVLCLGGTQSENRANARRIVQCVNAHDELLAALDDAVRLIEHLCGNAKAQRAAIANATGSAS